MADNATQKPGVEHAAKAPHEKAPAPEAAHAEKPGSRDLERHVSDAPRAEGRDAAYGERNALAGIASPRGDEGPVDLSEVVTVDGVKYDEDGRLVAQDGRPVALSADAFDSGIGWTAQHLDPETHGEAVNPFHSQAQPDQTFHPAELPDPVAALRAGLLPQSTAGLNIDPEKFANLKPLDV